MKTVPAALAALVLWLPPALADTEPVGIGFAQAEEGTWWCRSPDAGKALACATEKCRAAAGGQLCHQTRWCGLAGWSGMMIIWLPEFHSTSIICGAPSEPAVIAALKALCDNDEVVTRCEVVTIIDPDGKEKQTTDIAWPGPTAVTPDEQTPAASGAGPPADTPPAVKDPPALQRPE
jgi:hypothetical protein